MSVPVDLAALLQTLRSDIDAERGWQSQVGSQVVTLETEAKRTALTAANENIKILCRQFGIVCIDAYNLLADATDPTNRNESLFGTNDTPDGTHPTAPAYVAVANAILASMSSIPSAPQLNIVSGVTESNIKQINDTTVSGTAVDANMTQINGDATNDNLATLKLKHVEVVNSDNDSEAVIFQATGTNSTGFDVVGTAAGASIVGTTPNTGVGLRLIGDANDIAAKEIVDIQAKTDHIVNGWEGS